MEHLVEEQQVSLVTAQQAGSAVRCMTLWQVFQQQRVESAMIACRIARRQIVSRSVQALSDCPAGRACQRHIIRLSVFWPFIWCWVPATLHS